MSGNIKRASNLVMQEEYLSEAKKNAARKHREQLTELKPFSLSEVADETGFIPQTIVTLISRYDFISPSRTLRKNRFVYYFTPEELFKLQQLKSLVDQGYSMSQAVDHLKEKYLYDAFSNDLKRYLLQWLDDPTSLDNKHALVEMMKSMLDAFDPQLSQLFIAQYQQQPLVEAYSQINVNADDEVRKAIDKWAEAERLIGAFMFRLLLSK